VGGRRFNLPLQEGIHQAAKKPLIREEDGKDANRKGKERVKKKKTGTEP